MAPLLGYDVCLLSVTLLRIAVPQPVGGIPPTSLTYAI